MVHVRGQRLHVAECGASSSPLVLFLHSATGGWFDWRRVLPLLTDLPVHAVAVSLRGYGASDRTPAGYRPDAAADDATGRRGQFVPEVFTQASSRDPSACGLVRDDVALVRRLAFLFLGSPKGGRGLVLVWFTPRSKTQTLVYRSLWVGSRGSLVYISLSYLL